MEVAKDTEAAYIAAVSRVMSYVQKNLDGDLLPKRLAEVACFSPHHFHRVFRAIAGESLMEHVRRIRLERAAYRLNTSPSPVWKIAIDSGYGSQEAFARIFQAYFGLPPSEFRRAHASHFLPARCGVHYSYGELFPLRMCVDLDLLSPEGLCAFHRSCALESEVGHDLMLESLYGLASFVYPSNFGGEFQRLMENQMSDTITQTNREIETIMGEIESAKQRLVEARKKMPKQKVDDYVFSDVDGKPVKLSELFGDKKDLIVVHNMGTGCVYCTMWADGFTGLLPHLVDRAAFALSSPDKPEVQKRFAEKRNWKFKMVSAHDNSFFKDMGFWSDEGANPGPWPGVSTFQRTEDGSIYRVAHSSFGPGDDFCATWPFLDMLAEGANGWGPKYTYEDKEG